MKYHEISTFHPPHPKKNITKKILVFPHFLELRQPGPGAALLRRLLGRRRQGRAAQSGAGGAAHGGGAEGHGGDGGAPRALGHAAGGWGGRD